MSSEMHKTYTGKGEIPVSPETASSATSNAPRWRILIVDDEPLVQDLLREFVASSASYIDAAGSVARARHLLSHMDYDWVLLDNHLGDGKSLDLLKIIRHDAPETRVAMITSDARESDFIREATENGAERVIGKPFEHQEIVDLISHSRPERSDSI